MKQSVFEPTVTSTLSLKVILALAKCFHRLCPAPGNEWHYKLITADKGVNNKIAKLIFTRIIIHHLKKIQIILLMEGEDVPSINKNY